MAHTDPTIRITVHRNEFQAAIEAGIIKAGLTGEHADALRKVGREATLAARGHMDWDDVGCPLRQAGLYSPPTDTTVDGIVRTAPEWSAFEGTMVTKFYDSYDDVLGRITRNRNPQHRAADLVDILS